MRSIIHQLVMIGAVSAACECRAQFFVSDGDIIDGGFETASQGAYSLSGGIEGPATATSTGGTYSIESGLLALQSAVNPSIDSPLLTITRSASNVTISWDAAAKGFIIETTSNLSPPVSWTQTTGGSQNSVSFVILPVNQFFRLRFTSLNGQP